MNRREFIVSALAAGTVGRAKMAFPQGGGTSAVEQYALPSTGLFRVKPHAQRIDARTVGVGWMTAKPATGRVDWSQDGGKTWQKAWNEEHGLHMDAGSCIHCVELRDYDPTKALVCRAVSREISAFEPYNVVFAGDEVYEEISLDPTLPQNGGYSFAVLNDVHCNLDVYPTLLPHFGGPVNLTIFNGDIMSSISEESEIYTYLLAPLAYVTSQTKSPCRYLRGNHETRGSLARHLHDYLPLQEGRYYGAMSAGPVRFVFLDTGEDKPDWHSAYFGLVGFEPYLNRQIAWLRQEIASRAWNEALARVVVMHCPTSGNDQGQEWRSGLTRLDKLEEVLRTARASVVIAGHTHKRESDAACEDRPYLQVIGGGPNANAADPLGRPTVTRGDVVGNKLIIRQFDTQGSEVAHHEVTLSDDLGSRPVLMVE